jgi:organic hydroperoxide reductase OsmC/OhrA
MSEHTAHISWRQSGEDFQSGKFSRRHSWTFDGGLELPASASPGVVPPPLSDPAAIDPEEAFVASVASCHMLTFLFVAYKKKFSISSYEDEAVGSLSKNDAGIPWISRIVLRPRIVFSGDRQPSGAELDEMHEAAHRQCFISNSVSTEVTVEPGGG